MPPEHSGDQDLVLRDLAAFHGRVQVLWGLDLRIPGKGITAVIGPNGAGKSSLLSAISGQMLSRGSIRWQGEELLGLAPEEVVRRGITLVPEGGRLFTGMNCRDNLFIGAHLQKNRARRRELLTQVWTLFPVLEERRDQLAATLSGGERQMLAIGRALMSGPRILLLDEPTSGLAPKVAARVFAVLEQINRSGVGVLLVAQKVGHALSMAGQAYVLENGRVALSGPGPELLGHEYVRKAYLAL